MGDQYLWGHAAAPAVRDPIFAPKPSQVAGPTCDSISFGQYKHVGTIVVWQDLTIGIVELLDAISSPASENPKKKLAQVQTVSSSSIYKRWMDPGRRQTKQRFACDAERSGCHYMAGGEDYAILIWRSQPKSSWTLTGQVRVSH